MKLNQEQILFRCKFWQLVKNNYSILEIAKFTGYKKHEVRKRINGKGKRVWSENGIYCWYRRQYKRKEGELLYTYQKVVCG